jgi:hypothetical protein
VAIVKGEEMKKKKLELERIIFFSDAVFAIAITLLALNIKLPQDNGHLATLSLSRYLKFIFPHCYFGRLQRTAPSGNFLCWQYGDCGTGESATLVVCVQLSPFSGS